jgi:hypothetical protein
MAGTYAFCVVLSAFLLFQVEPMVGKIILPWFGGTSAVWSTVLLFFQCLLTAGYAYAYWLIGRLRPRQQATVHLVLLGLSVGLLIVTALAWPSPLMPGTTWRPTDNALPILGILKILTVAVGIPFFLLASNSTLMQAWFSREAAGRTPYRLYALSNAGSLAALITYPVLFEPGLTLRAQAYVWSGAFVVFAASAGFLAVRAARSAPAAEEPEAAGKGKTRPSVAVYLLWLGMAACATALLISVTNQITQEVAAIPFLWILPLSLYLLTFILAFSGGLLYSRRVYLVAFFILAFIVIWMIPRLPWFSMGSQIAIFCALLFVCSMICHNEIYALRPPARRLPSFYLAVAGGGAIGGIFVNLIAPCLFATGLWELQWAVLATGVLATVVLVREQRAPVSTRRRRRKASPSKELPAILRLKPGVIACLSGLVILSGLMIAVMHAFATNTLLSRRNFYGVLRVWETNTDQPEYLAYQLTHGRTVHGFQFESAELRDVPTTYYAETSGVGLALLHHPSRPGPLRVGGLGLGIGVIAHYGQPGDVFRFYEINPDMIKLAEGEGGYFSFLSDSPAQITVVAGDARLSLEREWASEGSHAFDVLVLDAFSGDSVPLHLLTREAFQIYLDHLDSDGVLAVNVSNRYFDLSLPIYRLAETLGLQATMIVDQGDGLQSYASIWMLLARDRSLLDRPAIAGRAAAASAVPAVLRLWTDDYSNLLQVLR